MPNQQAHFVNWFRDSSPYIHAHHNKTFVIFFNGEAVINDCDNLIHDFALLKSLGIRLVLVHGIRPQIDQRLKQQNFTSVFHQNLRITDEQVLQCVKEAAGLVRIEIEALLSMGLPNSPMAGAKIKVASGNFVIAKPLGIIDGIDYQHTGKVRRIEHAAIHQQLEDDNVVLISPIGYSPSGEIFNLAAEQVATEIAIALKAEKLILLTEQDCLSNQQLIQQMTTDELKILLQQDINKQQAQTLNTALQSCQRGVERVHLINRKTDGALLLELFTRDGRGTLVSSSPYEEIRSANLTDIAGILELIKPLEQAGLLIRRCREKLEIEIKDYIVIERDGLIIGCTALHLMKNKQSAEIACLAVHADYQKLDRGYRLLEHLQVKAKKLNIKTLFVLSTQAIHWFIERGFKEAKIESLPEQRKQFYNYQRNSKVLFKNI
ncbi:MAG: amino-acid N-acetyltransferase [Methylococcales symbiont of Iophon sp. n. MRB-2018]|nr:MAG: amino-acid N-acetyltransferase [Methylococcales symbiont of Iophon sp. n. MRB-2018]KAF3978948.1 MAG: amino-acid N-acetyltransferase [Methylococcales symbiont of Iophon sp. n. MRB-2018]